MHDRPLHELQEYNQGATGQTAATRRSIGNKTPIATWLNPLGQICSSIHWKAAHQWTRPPR